MMDMKAFLLQKFSTLERKQLPTISPPSRLICLLSSHYRINENPFSSSLKLNSTAGKTTGGGPYLECFSPAASSAADHVEVELRPELMPKHVALIMDGNGRWAKSRGLPIKHGHMAGSANLARLVSVFGNLGIKILTVYAFSTENWNRSEVEVNWLMSIFEDFIKLYVKELMQRYDVRFSIIGNRSELPKSLESAISMVEELSKGNKGIHLVGALNYSGRYDIVEASKKIARQVEDGILRAKDVDEALFEQQLMTSMVEFPDPDLLIRTSGELRVSNFLLWQLAYSELYFSDKVFPDFGEAEVVKALSSFQRRERRYGERKS